MNDLFCKLCKKLKATNHIEELHICDKCLIEIQLSFSYYINNKEVTIEEYKRKIDENK